MPLRPMIFGGFVGEMTQRSGYFLGKTEPLSWWLRGPSGHPNSPMPHGPQCPGGWWRWPSAGRQRRGHMIPPAQSWCGGLCDGSFWPPS